MKENIDFTPAKRKNRDVEEWVRETPTKNQTLYEENVMKKKRGWKLQENIRPIFINGTKLHVDKMIFPKTGGIMAHIHISFVIENSLSSLKMLWEK